jgi:NADPH2:quinone reductase
MRAVICRDYGPAEELVIGEMPAPEPGPGQILVEVVAAGVNFPDTLIIQNKYQRRAPVPFTPGSEVAGRVLRVAPDVTGFAPGDRVLAYTVWGGFAELCVAEAAQAYHNPDEVDFVAAAAFVLAHGTALYALEDRGQLKAGETLLVLGAAGGVGIGAIEAGKALGGRVIAAASSDEKLALCKASGADEVVNYTAGDLREQVKRLTGGQGVDVVLDPVGGPLAEPAMREMASGGRYLVVGFAAGEIPRIPLNLPLMKNFAVIGVVWGQFIQRRHA